MSELASFLERHNYTVINEDYPSTKNPIAQLANQYLQPMINKTLQLHCGKIYFVTHSLGGIVLRKYLSEHPRFSATRIVMLGPPNHGSQLVDWLHDDLLFRIFTGPAGQELSTSAYSVPNQLRFNNNNWEIGIIAGNYNLIPFGKFIFHEANDGKVSVSSTKLNGMKDFLVLPVSHTFMMNNILVENQILYYFTYGKFIR